MQREDDREETVRKRLAVYHAQTEPLVTFYSESADRDEDAPAFVRVDGIGTVEQIRDRILQALNA